RNSNSIWKLDQDSAGYGRLQQIFLDGTCQYYSWPCYNETRHRHRVEGRPRHGAEDMRFDPKRNSVWINSGEGLLEFSLNDKKFLRIVALDSMIGSKNYDRGVGIDIDPKGRVWFSTFQDGIFIYDPQTDQIRQLFSDHDLQRKSGEANLHVYCDPDGIVWTSDWTNKGLCGLLPFNPIVKRYEANPFSKGSLSGGMISSILAGPEGKLWIGTSNGLNIFDPVTEKFEVLHEKDLPGVKGTAIIPLYIDSVHQKAWLKVGLLQSIFQYVDMTVYEMDIRTRQCRRISNRNGSNINGAFGTNHYTLAAPYKDGFIFCDDALGFFQIREGSLMADLLMPYPDVFGGFGLGGFALAEDRYLFLQNAVTLPNLTFENKNGKWTKISHPFDNLNWSVIIYDKKDQTYWIGLINGIAHYDKEFRQIRSYSQDERLNDQILSMQFDNNGNIWYITNSKQLNRLNPATGVFTNLLETDGYHKQDYAAYVPGAKDARGNVYFGIGNSWDNADSASCGLDRIYTERYSPLTAATVYFKTLTVNRKSLPLYAGVNSLEELNLQYGQNTIKIETSIIDFYSKGKGHVRYKLEQNGRNEDWQFGQANQTILFEVLPAGSYRLVMQASTANNEFNGPEKILMINISPAFWNTWVFRIIAAIFVFTIFYLVIRYRTRQRFNLQLERSAKEKQIAEIKQKASELEMQALRAQMNPHFIFNSLNSINRFILQNNKAEASQYLIKFSKLVRMILQNSQASLISLESELESLGLYLEMEALRFNYHFDYKISVPKDLDIEMLKVPPLIIQPYVENAIWHGLMHKEDKGQLDIEVWQEGDWIYLKVTDNGIGRRKASELESKSATKHKSMGLRITASRIAMMQQPNGDESPVKVNDLVESDGTAAGTEVVIRIPLLYD
ncbi:MAG TPA: histidine kinase, partial [Puia sp.]|nr:histidine kinase [Puia sp.]